MPTADDEMARNCAKSFCENFLRAGGLRLDFKILTQFITLHLVGSSAWFLISKL